MQARGHQSISPPEQITQPRHGNQVSNTPPPQAAQQYFNPGSGFQRFEYLQQDQPLLQYKAYGSALNEPRAPGNGARVGLPQANIQQSTGNYYQQPTQNMRPPQPQQGPAAQQYFISTPAQPRGMRPQQPMTSPTTMVYLPTQFQGNNVVIPANVYQRMPAQYQQVSYPQYAPAAYNLYYQPNGGWQNTGLPQSAQNTRPESREKKILIITDPNTGRDITTEILRPGHHADSDEHHEEMPQTNQEICKTFTRLVADRLKAPDESNSSSATEGHVIGLTSGVVPVTTQPSQYQQPTQVQHQQQQPGPVLLPHSRPTLMHPSGAATPPQEMPYVDTTIPPPNIRQSTPMYNTQPQQQSHGNARMGQPHQQPQLRPQMAHVAQGSQQMAAPAVLATQIAQPSHSSQGLSSAVSDAAKSVPQKLVATSEKLDNDTPRQDIPAKPVAQPQAVKLATPAQEEIHISPMAEKDAEIKLASIPPEPVKEKVSFSEMSQIPDECVTDDTSVAKDGKKITNNKKKKDFNKKEIVGSEMDAFIDPSMQASETAELNRKVNLVEKHAVKVLQSSTTSETDGINVEVKQSAKCSSADTGDDAKLNLETNHCNTVHIKKTADTHLQVESKHKLKKKKKKKGRKTPPIQKSKQSTSAIETVEGSLHNGDQYLKQTSDTPKVEDKENETVENKLPITPPADESKNTKEKTSTKEVSPAIDIPTDKKITVVKEVIISTSATSDQQCKIIETALDKEPVKTAVVEQSTISPAETQLVATDLPPFQSDDIIQNNQMEQTEVPVVLSNSSSVEKINEKNIQSNKSTENEIAKDPVLKSQVDDGKKNSIPTDISTSNKSVSDTVPVKPDGKEVRRCYDRAQLMELRNCVSSQIKPKGLPNFEIIMDSPNEPSRGAAVTTDFTPIFFQSTPGNARHPPSMGKTSSRGRQRPGDATRIIKPISANDKPLHQSEKPWKPTQKLVHSGELVEKRKTLESDVLFIMNRLTPTNFERLAGEMRNLNIQSYEELTDLVKIFFDKVTMETKFVEAYAQLCKVMSSIKVPPPPNLKDSQSTFRVVMLTKCQQEFEADKSIVFEDPEEKKKKIEAEMPEGIERNDKIDGVLYQMKLKRLKFYGNIRFIGELFKLGMLTENIMHDCIYRLLKARDDDSLVSLCQLLTTVGQVLDTDKAKTRMDQYFNQMAKIAEERKSRIKFTLKDAIDLRSNNWVPRKEQTGPKKIDEVHKDFQQEQYTKQLMQSQPPPPRTDTVQPNSRRGSRQRQDEIKITQDDGWNTVGSKSLRIDASKMKLSKNVVDENSIQLGPGGGISKFSMWGRGSYGGSQPLQEERPAPSNRFTALRLGGGEEDRRNYQKSPSRGDNVANRGIRQGPTAGHGRGKIISRSITEGERRDGLGNTWPVSGGRSQNSSRDNSWNREDHRTLGPRGSRERENVMTTSDITLRPSSETSGAAPDSDFDELGIKKLQPLSEKEMEHKAKTILEEYLSVMDLEEAKLCLMELKGQAYLDILVSACINDVLEKSKQKRELTGQFFHEMVRNKLIPLDIYFKGLSEVLQVAEDMVIDIPMIWSYLAQLIAPVLIGGSVPWSNLIPTLKNNLDNRCCGKLLSEILLVTKEAKGENEAAHMWQISGLRWSMFMDETEVEKFLQDKKLEFTLLPVKASLQSKTSQIIFERVTEDIERIAKDGGSNSDIFTYIEKNVPREMQGNEFIRALTTAIASSSITTTKKPNEEAIKNCIKSHKDVLQHFIKSNVDLELQALYAIQALMHRLEHPSNVMGTLFDVLYDEDIISEEACKKWEKSTDPLEAEGKGACLMQLTQFFAWLKENEDPETS